MIDIDSYFKRGKSKKIRIWKKLNNYRKNNGNFVGRVLAEISTIYSASNNRFRGRLVYNLNGFIKDIEDLRIMRAR